jgi:hypothetical protein
MCSVPDRLTNVQTQNKTAAATNDGAAVAADDDGDDNNNYIFVQFDSITESA